MKIMKLMFVFILMLSLTGCLAVSINSFYTKGNLAQNEKILGEWVQVKEQDKEEADSDTTGTKISLRFENGITSGYDLALTEGEKTNLFAANLFLLNDQPYLDLYPQVDSIKEINSYFSSHLAKAHSIAKVQLSDEHLKLIFMDSDSLKKIMIRRKLKLDYAVISENDDQILLTGQTEALQNIIKKYDAELFGSNPMDFAKTK